jgi:hypothetical protein
MITTLWQSFDEWAVGRQWPGRVLVLGIMAFLTWQMIFDENHATIMSGINLAIHEGGHLLFQVFGEFLCICGGTIMQCAAPVISAIVLMRAPDYFGIPFCGVWLASNLSGVSVYVADARAMEIPLVSTGSGEIIHDWNFILSSMNMLSWDAGIATALRLSGALLAVASTIGCSEEPSEVCAMAVSWVEQ